MESLVTVNDLMNIVKKQRKDNFDKSDQLNLGMLIDKMELVIDNHRNDEDNKKVEVIYDFGYLFPMIFDSYRGSYDELALDYHDPHTFDDKGNKPLLINEFYKLCLDTIDKEFTGYKGGEYIMTRNTTPIWIANYGNSGNTALIDVLDKEYEVILITGYREF